MGPSGKLLHHLGHIHQAPGEVLVSLHAASESFCMGVGSTDDKPLAEELTPQSSLSATVSAMANSSQITLGQSISATVSVTGSGEIAPTGLVAFQLLDCGSLPTPCTTAPVQSETGATLAEQSQNVASAPVTLQPNTAGNYCIAANYSGDPTYAGSGFTVSAPSCFSVGQVMPILNLYVPNSLNEPTPQTGLIDYSATVQTPSGAVNATGTYTISDGANSCTYAVNGYGPVGPCTIRQGFPEFASQSPYTLTTTYSGDSNYLPATSTNTVDVAQAPAYIGISPSANPAVGGPVTYTANVYGTITNPTGNVSVSDGVGGSCQFALSGTTGFRSTGSCSIDEAVNNAVPYIVTATYSGDDEFLGASANISELVEGPPTLVLTPAENPAETGPVAYAVRVGGMTTSTPTGTVTISDGVGGTCQTVLAGGSGGCAINEQASESPLTVTASYGGDANYGSLSTSISEVINQGMPSLQIAPATDLAAGGKISFIVLVSGAGVTPTGPVELDTSNGGTCTASLNKTGVASCVVDTGAASSSYTVTASYPGDDNYSAASQALTDARGTSTSSMGTASASLDQTTVTATGQGSVSVLLYPGDPVGPPSFSSSGVFFDVASSQGNSFASQIVQDCDLNGGDELVWWSPTADSGAGAWLPVIGDPGPTYSAGPPACLTATLDANSSPSISQLTGTVFAVAQGAVNAPPAFFGEDSATVQASATFSTTVKTSASSGVTIQEQGKLPKGIKFHDNGNGTATISGNPGAKLTTYSFTLNASDAQGADSESYFLSVGRTPVFKSAIASLKLTIGHAKTTTLRPLGTPSPSFNETGTLPPGLTFTSSASGTAKITGAPTQAGSFSLVITASNVLGVAKETISVTVSGSKHNLLFLRS